MLSKDVVLCVEEFKPIYQCSYRRFIPEPTGGNWVTLQSLLCFEHDFVLCNSKFYIFFPVNSFCLLAWFWGWQRHKSPKDASNLVQWLLRRKRNEWLLLVWSQYLEHMFIFPPFLNFYIPRELACRGSQEWLLVLFSTLISLHLLLPPEHISQENMKQKNHTGKVTFLYILKATCKVEFGLYHYKLCEIREELCWCESFLLLSYKIENGLLLKRLLMRFNKVLEWETDKNRCLADKRDEQDTHTEYLKEFNK